jgi:hypothetical protein
MIRRKEIMLVRTMLLGVLAFPLVPCFAQGDDSPSVVGVWRRTMSIRKVDVVETWSVHRQLSGDLEIWVRYCAKDKDVASYHSVKYEWSPKTKTLKVGLENVYSVGKWPKKLLFSVRSMRDQLVAISPRGSGIRGGRLERVEDPGDTFPGEWVVTHSDQLRQFLTLTRDKEGKWSLRMRVLDGDREAGLAHADSFELRGDILRFRVLFDRRPSPGWKDYRVTSFRTGGRLKMGQGEVGAGHSHEST